MAIRYWLMKTEPDVFSIDDLARVAVEPWTGVRNYTARNHMRAMKVGDAVLIYHSSCTPPGVAGRARVARTGVVDDTQFDPGGEYHDPRATRQSPIWDCVEVAYVAHLSHFVALDRLRAEPALRDMVLLAQPRLSVQPVTPAQYRRIVAMSRVAAPARGTAPRAPRRRRQ